MRVFLVVPQSITHAGPFCQFLPVSRWWLSLPDLLEMYKSRSWPNGWLVGYSFEVKMRECVCPPLLWLRRFVDRVVPMPCGWEVGALGWPDLLT